MDKFKGEIESINWNLQLKILTIEGYAFINNTNISKINDIRKSIVLSNAEKTFIIPTQNIKRIDISEFYGNDKYNYDYSGFCSQIDLSFINNMSCLDTGEWKIKIYMNTKNIDNEYDLKLKSSVENNNNQVIKCIHQNILRKFYIKNNDNTTIIECIDQNVDSKEYKKYNKLKKDENENVKFILQNLYNLFKCCNIKQNRVLFLSDSRTDFSGNLKFVYDEIVSRNSYDIKYLFKGRIDEKKTIIDKIKFLYYISTSKYILLDDYYPQIYKFKIKSDIKIIQLWHAAGAFKTFGFSRLGKIGGPDIKSKNHRNYTHAIVSSKQVKRYYAEAFSIPLENIRSIGVPRTDIFFDEEYKKHKIEEIYKRYPNIKNKKVIIFAPTFRGTGQKQAYYDFNQLDINKLKTNLQDDYVFIIKIHPFVKNIPDFGLYENFVIDMSSEREINDLLFISDILITDYSSVCFEYSLLRKPMIFFAYDLNDYIEDRDFYYQYEELTPGPIATNTDDIIDIILNKKFEMEKVDKFKDKFLNCCDGKATKRVVDELLNIDKLQR